MNQVEVFHGMAFLDRYRDQEAALAQSNPQQLMTSRLRYYAPQFLSNQVTFALELDGKVVAIAGCEQATQADTLWLCYVAVDEGYRGRKLSTQLIERIAQYVRDRGYRTLECSGYSTSGLQRLRPVLQRTAQGFFLKDTSHVDYS